MAAIPFGIVGMVLGHLAMGRALSFMSLIGLVSSTAVAAASIMVFPVTLFPAITDCALSALKGIGSKAMPPYVAIPRKPYMTRPAYLGLHHSAFETGDPNADSYQPPQVKLAAGRDRSPHPRLHGS